MRFKAELEVLVEYKNHLTRAKIYKDVVIYYRAIK